MQDSPKKVLVLDQQEYWREFAERSLEVSNFVIVNRADPRHLGVFRYTSIYRPDLVILGCVAIGPEELSTIEHILAHQQPLLVLFLRRCGSPTSTPNTITQRRNRCNAENI